jgi:hypothetical protein
VQQGPCDANIGRVIKGRWQRKFYNCRQNGNGLYVPGDVRDMLELKTASGSVIVISKNEGAVQILKARYK